MVVNALIHKVFHHHALRGDACMVRPRQIKGVVSSHPVPAGENVDLRVLQHVPDVQRSGHVRRRNDDRKHRPGRIRIRFEQLFLYPEVCPTRFDLLRFVRLCYLTSHAVRILRVGARPWPALYCRFESFGVIFDYTREKAAASIRTGVHQSINSGNRARITSLRTVKCHSPWHLGGSRKEYDRPCPLL